MRTLLTLFLVLSSFAAIARPRIVVVRPARTQRPSIIRARPHRAHIVRPQRIKLRQYRVNRAWV
ncbi:MAG: hypothetical protein HYX27_25430 [Acidobacteria bacterium]|nr:hypothetical protein [Acidobacteriota bacterium]